MGVRSADDAWASARVDKAKVEATSEADIEAYMTADGEKPDAPFEGYLLLTEGRNGSPVKRSKRGRKTVDTPPILRRTIG